jgi:DNA-binding XRE family transcriptional regulator
MNTNHQREIDCRHVELDGIEYVILRRAEFEVLCRMAQVEQPLPGMSSGMASAEGMDRATLAEKLARRRRAAGLSQAELARRAGLRAETVNRIERGRNTPDFATVRKLVVAMNEAETERLTVAAATSSTRENVHAQAETHDK